MSVLPSEARRVGHKIKCPPFGEEGRRTFMPEGWLLIPTAAAVTNLRHGNLRLNIHLTGLSHVEESYTSCTLTSRYWSIHLIFIPSTRMIAIIQAPTIHGGIGRQGFSHRPGRTQLSGAE